MTKKYLLFAFVGLIILFYSCKKEKFDFSRLNTIEASGEWGIPLLNAQYFVEDILNQLQTENYIKQTENGNLFLNYELDTTTLFKAVDFMSFQDISASETSTFPNIYLPGMSIELPFNHFISLENDQIMLKSGKFREGTLRININHNIDKPYNLTISFPEVRTGDGEMFSLNINSITGNYSRIIDLKDFTISPQENNKITYQGKISFSTSSDSDIENYIINYSYSITGCHLKSISGKIATQTHRMNESKEFNLFNNQYGGNMILHNPKLTFHTVNSFSLLGRCEIDTAEFRSERGSSSILSQPPVIIDIPFSSSEHSQTITGIDRIPFSTDFTSFHIGGKAIINPDGFNGNDVTITDESIIKSRISLSVPFQLEIGDAFYYDTTDFSVNTQTITDMVDALNFRLVLVNGIPLNLKTQIYFYDSQKKEILDSLFKNEGYFGGTFTSGAPPKESISFVDVEKNRLKNISSADKIIMRFRLNTSDRTIFLNASHNLKVILGMKLKYSSFNID